MLNPHHCFYLFLCFLWRKKKKSHDHLPLPWLICLFKDQQYSQLLGLLLRQGDLYTQQNSRTDNEQAVSGADRMQCSASGTGQGMCYQAAQPTLESHASFLKLTLDNPIVIGEMVTVLSLFQQLSANIACGKIYTGNLCPQPWTLARDHAVCVVS